MTARDTGAIVDGERGPILVASLLPIVEGHLAELLDDVSATDWMQPTIVPGWRVKDVAAHLLDTATRKLALVRDGFVPGDAPGPAPDDLRTFIDRLNAEGVAVYGRLSRPVLRTLHTMVSREFCDFHLALDPFAPATFAVSWAGESASLNWFDTARELTERWHHQQQLRLALDRPGIMTRELYHPVLDCFMRVLPHAYRDVDAPPGTTVLVRVEGECGGDWPLVRGVDRWRLTTEPAAQPAVTVSMPEALAWRLFTKGARPDELRKTVAIQGALPLALPALGATAIVG